MEWTLELFANDIVFDSNYRMSNDKSQSPGIFDDKHTHTILLLVTFKFDISSETELWLIAISMPICQFLSSFGTIRHHIKGNKQMKSFRAFLFRSQKCTLLFTVGKISND